MAPTRARKIGERSVWSLFSAFKMFNYPDYRRPDPGDTPE
jgi:hypothetical protein